LEVVPNHQYVAPRGSSFSPSQGGADQIALTELTQHFHDQAIIDFGLPKDEW